MEGTVLLLPAKQNPRCCLSPRLFTFNAWKVVRRYARTGSRARARRCTLRSLFIKYICGEREFEPKCSGSGLVELVS